MVNKHTFQRIAYTFATLAIALSIAGAAFADTIYLKNGRIIRSAQVRTEGDRVFFTQYGGEVSLPLELVDRIEKDASAEPAPTTGPAPGPIETAEPTEGAGESDAEGEAEEAPEEQTQEYWQERVLSLEAERQQVQDQIADLRRTEQAFLFSHRSTADTRRQIEEAQQRLTELDEEYRNLQTEARRAGVPAGWLRAPRDGGGGSGGGTSEG